MQIFSQRDPRWRGALVGKSGRTLGQIGCLVTGLAMLSDYFKPTRNPFEMLQMLKFTDDGRVYWSSVHFENWEFYKRVYGREQAQILRHIKDPNLAVILEVANKSHWVVATGVQYFTGAIRIADPLFGDRSTVRRYQNNITGAAYFKRK